MISEPAFAQANDNWVDRTQIAALPFSVSETLASQATTEPTDPVLPCPSASSNPLGQTLWYGYTAGASVEYLTLRISGSVVAGRIGVYTGAPGSFRMVTGGCTGVGSPIPDNTRIVGMRLMPGQAVSIIIGTQFSISPGTPIPFSVVASARYDVTKTADTRDGACDADCSLREAVDAANGASGVVLIPPGTYTLSRAGALENNNDSGDLDLNAATGVFGAGPALTIIDAGQLDRVFDVNPSSFCCPPFSLGEMHLRNGRVLTATEGRGGALRSRGGSFFGIERLVATGSFAQESGGGMYLTNGGRIRESLAQGNEADFGGGGLSAFTSIEFEVEASAFIGNDAPQGGGVQLSGPGTIVNSTIAGNVGQFSGSGLDLRNSNGSVAMLSNTVTDNGAPFGSALRIETAAASLLAGNVIARNAGADCESFGAAVLSRYNHVQVPSSCGFVGTGDVTGTSAGLATQPANHGGPTPTYALLGGSPLLDSGDPAGCVDASGAPLLTDQRGAGFPRQVGVRCDKGALESPVVTPPAGAPDLSAASDSGSSNSDNITNVVLPTFTGPCANGSTLQLSDASTPLLPTAACAAASYAITLSTPLAEGLRSIAATATVGGDTSLRSDAIVVRIDLTGPAAPTLGGPTQSVSTEVPVSGTTGEPLGAVVVSEGAMTRCATNATAGSTWACTVVLPEVGAHTLAATHTDLAGNPGTPSTPLVVTVSDTLLADGFEDPAP